MTVDGKKEVDWTLTTWKGSRLQQHREFAALPFRRKLEIIEEMAALAAKPSSCHAPPNLHRRRAPRQKEDLKFKNYEFAVSDLWRSVLSALGPATP